MNYAEILTMLLECSEISSCILNQLRPSDITSFVNALGIRLATYEKKKYLVLWREVFTTLDWQQRMTESGYRVVFGGLELLDMIKMIREPQIQSHSYINIELILQQSVSRHPSQQDSTRALDYLPNSILRYNASISAIVPNVSDGHRKACTVYGRHKILVTCRLLSRDSDSLSTFNDSTTLARNLHCWQKVNDRSNYFGFGSHWVSFMPFIDPLCTYHMHGPLSSLLSGRFLYLPGLSFAYLYVHSEVVTVQYSVMAFKAYKCFGKGGICSREVDYALDAIGRSKRFFHRFMHRMPCSNNQHIMFCLRPSLS
jgi:hypothetical protein